MSAGPRGAGATSTWPAGAASWRMPVRRLRCPAHGVVTEAVPFAPARSGYTYAFEDEVAWLAQRADKTAITCLRRITWRSVSAIIERWIPRHRCAEQLAGLARIAVDEKSWRRGHRYVSLVADHERPRAVWMAEGRKRGPQGRDPRRILQYPAGTEGAVRAAQARGVRADVDDEPGLSQFDAHDADLWDRQQPTQYRGLSHPDLLDGFVS